MGIARGRCELTINLAALRANWRLLADKVSPAECAAVVKADAYGIGLGPAARALWAEGARTFFVARLTEGVLAREILPEATIYVLDGLPPNAAPIFARLRLRPALSSLEEVVEWARAGLPAHQAALHFDTGIHRLGLDIAEAAAAMDLLGAPPALIMSHFTSSESPDSSDNEQQIALFAKVLQELENIPASLSNSSGIYLLSKPYYQMVRAGIALYGGNPTPGQPNPMRAVATLRAPILQVRDVNTGAGVGYGRRWAAPSPSRLAILGVGYADGIPRGAMGANVQGEQKNGARVLIGGQACPIVGRVSMDMILIDATAAPIAEVRRGGWAELFGDTMPIDDFAAGAGTISYEILTNLSKRAHRIYVGG